MTESEYREFIREQTLRHERATRRMERWLQLVERRTEAQIAELRDLREESQAQRAALLLVLDELRSGGAPPQAA